MRVFLVNQVNLDLWGIEFFDSKLSTGFPSLASEKCGPRQVGQKELLKSFKRLALWSDLLFTEACVLQR